MTETLETWSSERVHRVIQFSWSKHFCLVEIHCQLTGACGDGVLGILNVRKRDGDFENIIYIYIYIYLTAIWLTPGGSRTAHIYTQTVHRIHRTELT
jgi:hypothetical protein